MEFITKRKLMINNYEHDDYIELEEDDEVDIELKDGTMSIYRIIDIGENDMLAECLEADETMEETIRYDDIVWLQVN